MSSAAAYRLLASIEEFGRSFPEDYGDIKARLGEIEKQVRGEVFAKADGGDQSPGQQAASEAASGDAERQAAQRRPFADRGTEDQPKTFGDARKAAEARFDQAAEAAPAPAGAGPSA